MSTSPNVFVGTWKLNPEKSEFSPYHRPTGATMSFTLEPDGHYLMLAEGIYGKGEKCVEKPQRFIPDGEPHPLPDLPGLTAIATCPDPHTIQTEARREDGSIVGQGSYIVSPDGTYLTATTSGYDTQLRQFRQHTVWDRA